MQKVIATFYLDEFSKAEAIHSANQNRHMSWNCPKCQSSSFEEGKMFVTGGTASRLLNIQNNKFITVTCNGCNYTELYRGDKPGFLAKTADFLVG